MNPKSRERAVDVVFKQVVDCLNKRAQPHDAACQILDAILAAGFHVAEWRKVEEAEDLSEYLAFNRLGRYDIAKADWPGFELYDGFPLQGGSFPTAVMDLPEPPKDQQ